VFRCSEFSRIALAGRRLAASLHRFSENRQGGVLVFFAFAFVPLAIAVGAAVDYTYASKIKARLDAAADLAALNGVKTSNVMPTAAAAKAAAIASFQANMGTLNRATLTSSAITVDDDGLGRTSTVTYSAQVQTSLMALVGITSIPISGSVKANSNLPTYIDFHILLDNTPSMGIGATPSDVSKMVANTSDQCGFACHDLSDPSGNYYKLAKTLGVTMRIDVVRQATQSLMDTAAATERVNDQFRTQLYTFGSSCTVPGYTLINGLTANLSQAKAAANNIDLMTIPYQGYNNDQCSDFNATLAAVNLTIAAPGDGSTAATPQKVLFFVSDGVADFYNPTSCTKRTTGGRCQEPINTATCAAIKARGVRIAVLYTTYLPLPTNGWYNSWIKPFQSEIATRMQTCASPGLYFEVSPTQGIADAMNALFQKAVATARLTQ
jgi:Flp pilus assembly protein TadG